MGHLFYTELGATALSSVFDTGDPTELAKFTNIQAESTPFNEYIGSQDFVVEEMALIRVFASAPATRTAAR